MNFVLQYTQVYCEQKAARGWALYCDTVRSQAHDTTKMGVQARGMSALHREPRRRRVRALGEQVFGRWVSRRVDTTSRGARDAATRLPGAKTRSGGPAMTRPDPPTTRPRAYGLGEPVRAGWARLGAWCT